MHRGTYGATYVCRYIRPYVQAIGAPKRWSPPVLPLSGATLVSMVSDTTGSGCLGSVAAGRGGGSASAEPGWSPADEGVAVWDAGLAEATGVATFQVVVRVVVTVVTAVLSCSSLGTSWRMLSGRVS